MIDKNRQYMVLALVGGKPVRSNMHSTREQCKGWRDSMLREGIPAIVTRSPFHPLGMSNLGPNPFMAAQQFIKDRKEIVKQIKEAIGPVITDTLTSNQDA